MVGGGTPSEARELPAAWFVGGEVGEVGTLESGSKCMYMECVMKCVGFLQCLGSKSVKQIQCKRMEYSRRHYE